MAHTIGHSAGVWIRRPQTYFVIALSAVVLFPLVTLFAQVVADPGVFRRATAMQGFGQALTNTFVIALASVVVAVPLGAFLAVCVVRSPRRAQSWLEIALLLPLFMPGVVNAVGWVFLLSPRVGYLNTFLRNLPLFSASTSGPLDIFTVAGIALLTGLYSAGFVFLYVRATLEEMGAELELAAAVAGASPRRVLRTVTLPLVRPALAYSAGIAFLLGLGQLTNPLMLGQIRQINTLTTLIYQATSQFPVDYALGAALTAPLLLVGIAVIAIQRIVIGDPSRFAVVTGRGYFRPASESRWALLPPVLYVFMAVVLPVAALVVVSLSPFWSGKIDWGTLGPQNFATVFNDARVLDATTTTLTATAIALAVVIPLGLAIALILSQGSSLLARVVDWVSTVPLSMPTAIFAFAFLSAYALPPFNLYGTLAIITFAYVVLMIPHSVRPQLASLHAVGREYGEASQISGAGLGRTTLRVTIPLARRGMAASAAIVVIFLTHEFAASVLLRSVRTQVLGTLLYDYYSAGTYPEVAVMGLLMVGITAVGVAITLFVGGRRVLRG